MAALAAIGGFTSKTTAATYTFTNLGVVSTDASSSGLGINNNTSVEVVGQSINGNTGASQPAFSRGEASAHPFFGAFSSTAGGNAAANAINDGGIAVGYYTSGANQLAFYSNTNTTKALTALPTFGGNVTMATGVNGSVAAFEVVGQSNQTTGGDSRSFSWTNSTPTSLTALDPAGMTGLGATGSGTQSVALGLNSAGNIVGHATNASDLDDAYLYSASTQRMYDLGSNGGSEWQHRPCHQWLGCDCRSGR